MTITDLATRDAAERARLHDKAIRDVQWQIHKRATQHAYTEALERHLTRLQTDEH